MQRTFAATVSLESLHAFLLSFSGGWWNSSPNPTSVFLSCGSLQTQLQLSYVWQWLTGFVLHSKLNSNSFPVFPSQCYSIPGQAQNAWNTIFNHPRRFCLLSLHYVIAVLPGHNACKMRIVLTSVFLPELQDPSLGRIFPLHACWNKSKVLMITAQKNSICIHLRWCYYTERGP